MLKGQDVPRMQPTPTPQPDIGTVACAARLFKPKPKGGRASRKPQDSGQGAQPVTATGARRRCSSSALLLKAEQIRRPPMRRRDGTLFELVCKGDGPPPVDGESTRRRARRQSKEFGALPKHHEPASNSPTPVTLDNRRRAWETQFDIR